MNNRIRYVKSTNGYVSMHYYGPYQIVLSEDQLTGKILDVRNNATITEVVGTSPHKTKIKIKNALTKLGYKGEVEKRNKE